MTRNDPPLSIYLQVRPEDGKTRAPGEKIAGEDITWCEDQIFDTDVRYVIDKRYLRKKRKSTEHSDVQQNMKIQGEAR